MVQILYVTGITEEPRGPYFKFRESTKNQSLCFGICISVLENTENVEQLGILLALTNPLQFMTFTGFGARQSVAVLSHFVSNPLIHVLHL